jgi:hypothetical protein
VANTDIALHPGNPWLFNYETVLCAWIALSMACGLYLFGSFRLPHDTPEESISVPRMLLASIFFGLALFMAPALWREVPLGPLGQGLFGFLPLDTKQNKNELEWSLDYEHAWREAAEADELLFVDFTGTNCANCRTNEKTIFPQPGVHAQLEKYRRVRVYTDYVPDSKLSASETREKGIAQLNLQRNTYGDISRPMYAIIKPKKGEEPLIKNKDGDTVFNGADVHWTRVGLITDAPKFEKFLIDARTVLGNKKSTSTK